MYNEKLEQLIDAALTDGTLTEKEKQVLFKKAMVLGVDLDEFEMVLDSRLVKLKKEAEEKAISSAPKSNKFGDVKKCPACGAIVQSFQGTCPECGYAFENIEANKSYQKLAEAIDKIMAESSPLSQIFKLKLRTRVIETIKNFPIPNTKADLMEFIISLQSKSKDIEYGYAYRTKLQECVDKVNVLFPHDKDLEPLVKQYNKTGFIKIWNKLGPRGLLFILSGLMFLIITIISLLSAHSMSKKEKQEDQICSQIVSEVQHENYDTAIKLYEDNCENYDIEKSLNTATSIVKAYLSKGDFESAEMVADKIKNSWSSECEEKVINILYTYYLENEMYSNAKEHVKQELMGSYMKDVVIKLCNNGKFEEAQQFLNLNKLEISNGKGVDKLCGNTYPTEIGGIVVNNDREYITQLLQNYIDDYK